MSVTDSGSTLLCAECQQRRVTAVASLQSRHAAPVEMNSGQHRFRLFAQTPPSWLVAGVLGLVAAALYSTMGLPNLAVVLLAQAFRIGPLQELLRNLPEIHSLADFENRHYRVQQSLWLVSLCSGIYTLIPEETLEAANQGWKINLVTMETSMASGIAATYGYSVAGGVPGGLLAEYVMPLVGKPTVAEVTPFVGPGAAKAITSCGQPACSPRPSVVWRSPSRGSRNLTHFSRDLGHRLVPSRRRSLSGSAFAWLPQDRAPGRPHRRVRHGCSL